MFILIALVCGLFCAAPLSFNLDHTGGKSGGLSAYAGYLWFRRDLGPQLKLRFLSGAARFFSPSLRRFARWRRFRLKLLFSAGEAAETALAYGGLCRILAALEPGLGRCRPTIALNPVFSAEASVDGECAVSISFPAIVILFYFLRYKFSSTLIKLSESS
jgi:hypothetical protein